MLDLIVLRQLNLPRVCSWSTIVLLRVDYERAQSLQVVIRLVRIDTFYGV